MRKLCFVVAGMLLSLGLAAQNHFYFDYGSGFSSTGSSLSFNYGVVCNDLSGVGGGGTFYGRVTLQGGSQPYYIGSFKHGYSSNGSVTVYSPVLYTENPFNIAPSTMAPSTTGSTTVTMPVNTTCIPAGTYTVRLEIYTYLTPPPEIQHNAVLNFTVGSNTYTPGLWHVHPGGLMVDALITSYIGSGNIGSFTVSSGGGSISGSSSVTPGTCTSHPVINTTTTGGTSPYTLYYSLPSSGASSITSSSAAINIPNATQGTYNLQLVDANGCRWSDVETTVKPTATVNVTPVSQTICKQTCVTFGATSGSGGTGFSYNWQHSNSGTAPHTVSTSFTFSHDVPHVSALFSTANTYQVTMSNAYCTGTGLTVQTVTQACTSRGGACSETTDPESRPSGQGNGLPSIGNSLKLFPNPTAGNLLNINFSEVELSNARIEVYDAMGRLMGKRPITEGMMMMELDISNFSQGIYMVRFVTHGEVLFSEKFVRQ